MADIPTLVKYLERYLHVSLYPFFSPLLLLGLILFGEPAFAQQRWTRTYGGTMDEWGYSVQQTSDGGYVLTGFTSSFGAGLEDVYLIKTNAFGDTIWTKTYGGTGYDQGRSIQQTSDGGYILTGFTSSFGAGNYDFYLIKTNASGNTLWTKTYGGTGSDWGNFVRQTSDGGYIIVGGTKSFGAGNDDVYLIKTNASGDTLWTKTYGGTGYDQGRSIQQTSDGGYIITGLTTSFGAGGGDVYLIKTNASGDTIWTKTYGGTNFDMCFSVQQTTDGGYIIAGETASFGAGLYDVYIIKTNASGDTIWTKTYGGAFWEQGCFVQQTSDGGYIITGCKDSVGLGNYDVYLIKTSASGDTLWAKIYGGTSEDKSFSVQQTTDGGYIIAGYTKSFGAGGTDAYLIKTDANGNIGVEEEKTKGGRQKAVGSLKAIPNPFVSFATAPGHENERFALYDISGRWVGTYKGDRIGEGLSAGVYFLMPESKDTKPVRVVKVR